MRELFIDFETGGLDPNTSGVCSLCIRENGISNYWEFQPISNKTYTKEALDINGFNLESMKEKGESIEKIINEIEQIIWERIGMIKLIGHNVSFDYGFLKMLLTRLPPMELYCTLHEAKKRFPYMRGHNLQETYKEVISYIERNQLQLTNYKIPKLPKEENPHTARYDVLMTELIYSFFEK